MRFTANNYKHYKDTKVSLYPKRNLKYKFLDYRWEVIIPFMMILISIIIVAMMQVKPSLA